MNNRAPVVVGVAKRKNKTVTTVVFSIPYAHRFAVKSVFFQQNLPGRSVETLTEFQARQSRRLRFSYIFVQSFSFVSFRFE